MITQQQIELYTVPDSEEEEEEEEKEEKEDLELPIDIQLQDSVPIISSSQPIVQRRVDFFNNGGYSSSQNINIFTRNFRTRTKLQLKPFSIEKHIYRKLKRAKLSTNNNDKKDHDNGNNISNDDIQMNFDSNIDPRLLGLVDDNIIHNNQEDMIHNNSHISQNEQSNIIHDNSLISQDDQSNMILGNEHISQDEQSTIVQESNDEQLTIIQENNDEFIDEIVFPSSQSSIVLNDLLASLDEEIIPAVPIATPITTVQNIETAGSSSLVNQESPSNQDESQHDITAPLILSEDEMDPTIPGLRRSERSTRSRTELQKHPYLLDALAHLFHSHGIYLNHLLIDDLNEFLRSLIKYPNVASKAVHVVQTHGIRIDEDVLKTLQPLMNRIETSSSSYHHHNDNRSDGQQSQVQYLSQDKKNSYDSVYSTDSEEEVFSQTPKGDEPADPYFQSSPLENGGSTFDDNPKDIPSSLSSLQDIQQSSPVSSMNYLKDQSTDRSSISHRKNNNYYNSEAIEDRSEIDHMNAGRKYRSRKSHTPKKSSWKQQYQPTNDTIPQNNTTPHYIRSTPKLVRKPQSHQKYNKNKNNQTTLDGLNIRSKNNKKTHRSRTKNGHKSLNNIIEKLTTKSRKPRGLMKKNIAQKDYSNMNQKHFNNINHNNNNNGNHPKNNNNKGQTIIKPKKNNTNNAPNIPSRKFFEGTRNARIYTTSLEQFIGNYNVISTKDNDSEGSTILPTTGCLSKLNNEESHFKFNSSFSFSNKYRFQGESIVGERILDCLVEGNPMLLLDSFEKNRNQTTFFSHEMNLKLIDSSTCECFNFCLLKILTMIKDDTPELEWRKNNQILYNFWKTLFEVIIKYGSVSQKSYLKQLVLHATNFKYSILEELKFYNIKDTRRSLLATNCLSYCVLLLSAINVVLNDLEFRENIQNVINIMMEAVFKYFMFNINAISHFWTDGDEVTEVYESLFIIRCLCDKATTGGYWSIVTSLLSKYSDMSSDNNPSHQNITDLDKYFSCIYLFSSVYYPFKTSSSAIPSNWIALSNCINKRLSQTPYNHGTEVRNFQKILKCIFKLLNDYEWHVNGEMLVTIYNYFSKNTNFENLEKSENINDNENLRHDLKFIAGLVLNTCGTQPPDENETTFNSFLRLVRLVELESSEKRELRLIDKLTPISSIKKYNGNKFTHVLINREGLLLSLSCVSRFSFESSIQNTIMESLEMDDTVDIKYINLFTILTFIRLQLQNQKDITGSIDISITLLSNGISQLNSIPNYEIYENFLNDIITQLTDIFISNQSIKSLYLVNILVKSNVLYVQNKILGRILGCLRSFLFSSFLLKIYDSNVKTAAKETVPDLYNALLYKLSLGSLTPELQREIFDIWYETASILVRFKIKLWDEILFRDWNQTDQTHIQNLELDLYTLILENHNRFYVNEKVQFHACLFRHITDYAINPVVGYLVLLKKKEPENRLFAFNEAISENTFKLQRPIVLKKLILYIGYDILPFNEATLYLNELLNGLRMHLLSDSSDALLYEELAKYVISLIQEYSSFLEPKLTCLPWFFTHLDIPATQPEKNLSDIEQLKIQLRKLQVNKADLPKLIKNLIAYLIKSMNENFGESFIDEMQTIDYFASFEVGNNAHNSIIYGPSLLIAILSGSTTENSWIVLPPLLSTLSNYFNTCINIQHADIRCLNIVLKCLHNKIAIALNGGIDLDIVKVIVISGLFQLVLVAEGFLNSKILYHFDGTAKSIHGQLQDSGNYSYIYPFEQIEFNRSRIWGSENLCDIVQSCLLTVSTKVPDITQREKIKELAIRRLRQLLRIEEDSIAQYQDIQYIF